MVFKERAQKMIASFFATAFFAWVIILFILSVKPANEHIRKINDESGFRLDYLEHFGAFLLLSVLFVLWRRFSLNIKRQETLYFLLLGGSYAAITELLQLFIESRTFNPIDLLFNLGGILVGVAILKIYIFK